jgi:hypothetical protein
MRLIVIDGDKLDSIISTHTKVIAMLDKYGEEGYSAKNAQIVLTELITKLEEIKTCQDRRK